MLKYFLLGLLVLGCAVVQAQFATPDTTICPNQQLDLIASGGSSSKTILALWDDNFSAPIPIGFPFVFYGDTFDSVLIGANSILSFELQYANLVGPWGIDTAIPQLGHDSLLHNTIMGPFQDLIPQQGGEISYGISGQAPNRIFYVSYCDVQLFNDNQCSGLTFTGQIHLLEGSNRIETHIQHKDSCTSWNFGHSIHGLQSADSTIADAVPGRNFPEVWATQNDGMRFTPNGNNGYTIVPIAYQPLAIGPTVSWTSLDGTLLHVGDTFSVTPAQTSAYVAEVNWCVLDSSIYDTVLVSTNCSNACVSPFVTQLGTINCFGDSTASLVLAPLGGSSPWTVTVSDSQNNTVATYTSTGSLSTLFDLPAGTYVIQTSDTSGCLQTDSHTVVQPAPLVLQSSATTEFCEGACDAEVVLTASGGDNSQYLYSLNQGQNFQVSSQFDQLCPGSYEVLLQDASGCVTTDSFQVGAAPQPLVSLSGLLMPESCFAVCDGSVEGVAMDGYPPYAYSIDGGQTLQIDPQFDFLCPGSYALSVVDIHGCESAVTVTVDSAAELEVLAAIVTSATFGNNGKIELAVGGGIAPYSYDWSNGATTAINDSLAAGTYEVDIYDANSCVITQSYQVDQITGISKEASISGYRVYPNPVSGNQLSIEIQGTPGQSLQLQLFDPLGRKVTEKQVITSSSTTRIDDFLADLDLQAGNYFLRLSSEEYQQTVKVVVMP